MNEPSTGSKIAETAWALVMAIIAMLIVVLIGGAPTWAGSMTLIIVFVQLLPQSQTIVSAIYIPHPEEEDPSE